MYKHSNYNNAPVNFICCANSNCSNQSKCLRYNVLQSHQLTEVSVNILNPNMYSADSEYCCYFKEDKMYSFALGITHIFDKIPYVKAKEMRAKMIVHFGKSMFYRFLRKEKYINPIQQQWIEQLFKKHNIVEVLNYDEYKLQYNWE